MKKRRRSNSRPPQANDSPSPSPVVAEATPWYFYAMRVVLVGALAATLRETWPLWSDRVEPPSLPLAPWFPFSQFGTLMIVTAATFIVWPRTGLAAHVLVTLAAMTADQTRMQPQIFSFWLLMLGTLPQPTARFVGRSHLASLWFFSGFHKLISARYYSQVAPFLWSGMFSAEMRARLPDLASPMAAVLAVVEMLLGLAVLFPMLRRGGAAVAVAVHLSVLWVLHNKGNWNTSVWPWNMALATVGAGLIFTWRRSLREEWFACGRLGFGAGVAVFVAPAMFYLGLLDAYLSHCLYSANTPNAVFFPATPGSAPYAMNGIEGPYWRNLNVPQPPAHRIFRAYFEAVAKPGDRMVVEDERYCAEWGGYRRYVLERHENRVDRRVLPPLQ